MSIPLYSMSSPTLLGTQIPCHAGPDPASIIIYLKSRIGFRVGARNDT